MGKFNKKNRVKLDLAHYGVLLLGEPKVGKTSMLYKVCEEEFGDEGYIFAEMVSEKGAEAIEGIVRANIVEWDLDEDDPLWLAIPEDDRPTGMLNFIDDIVENKSTDYPNLKVVVFDTYDGLISLAEQEAIDSWNRLDKVNKDPNKRATTLNQTWGYDTGKKVIQLMFEQFDRLESVGVKQTLTSDQQQNYFNALKKHMDFLGLAYIDREIAKEKTGNKDIKNKDIMKSVVKEETRKVKFRDDNYAIDSGCRFAEIVPEVDLDAKQFIKALKDAIEAERSKSGKPLNEDKKEQEENNNKIIEAISKAEAERKAKEDEKNKLKPIVEEITDFLKENKTDRKKITPVLQALKENGIKKPSEIENVDVAQSVLDVVNSLQ